MGKEEAAAGAGGAALAGVGCALQQLARTIASSPEILVRAAD